MGNPVQAEVSVVADIITEAAMAVRVETVETVVPVVLEVVVRMGQMDCRRV